MKFKMAIFFGMMILISSSFVSAQIQQPGITPDSLFYGLDILFENIQLTVSNNPETGIAIASEKLEEILRTDIKNFKEINMQREKALEHAEKNSKTEEQKERLNDVLDTHIDVLNNVKKITPEQAQKGLDNAIENSQKQIQVDSKAENKGMKEGGIYG